MIFTTPAPITHTGASPFEVDLADHLGNYGDRTCEILIQNLSRISLGVQIKEATYALPAGVANVYPLPPGSRSVKFTPRNPATKQQGIRATSDLYQVELTVSTDGERIPGTYPAAVVVPDAFALGTLDIPTLTSPNQIDVGRPAGINWLRLNVFAGSLLELSVVGDQTGTTYLDITGTQTNQLAGVFGCQITEAADTSVTVSGVVAAAGSATVRITGYPSEDLSTGSPRAEINPSQVLVAASNAGQAVVSGIPDTSAFAPGDSVLIQSASGAYPPQLATVQLLSAGPGTPPPAAQAVQLTATLQNATAIGDVITRLPIVGVAPAGVWTNTSISPPAASSTLYQLLASNPNRRGALVGQQYFTAGQAISIAGVATSNRQLTIPSGGYWEMPAPVYTGQLRAITEQVNTSATVVMEIT